MKNLDRRMVEHGRIRLGEKGAKGQPVKIDSFRFTSHDEKAIRAIAKLYGGTVKPWNQGQFEVKTTSNDIPVVLPPDPLGGTPIYELWSGGGCQRRCDGEIALVPQQGPEGFEMVEKPCVCEANETLACKPTTRLTVILPEINFGGGWRLESGGWNVAKEMPGMVDAIQEFAARGFTRAHLSLEQRTSKQGGKTMHYVVPVLRPDVSLQELVDGHGGLKAISMAPEVAKAAVNAITSAVEDPAPAPVDEWDDDTIVDAEIVGEETTAPASSPASDDPTRPFEDPMREAVDEVLHETKRKQMMALLREMGMGTAERMALSLRVSEGEESSSAALSTEQIQKVIAAVTAVRNGKAELTIDERGWAKVERV